MCVCLCVCVSWGGLNEFLWQIMLCKAWHNAQLNNRELVEKTQLLLVKQKHYSHRYANLILTCWCLFFMHERHIVRKGDTDNERLIDAEKRSWELEIEKIEWEHLGVLPCLLQDTSGFGWPCAIHSITAGRPSTTVAFWGGATITTLFRASVEPITRKKCILFNTLNPLIQCY